MTTRSGQRYAHRNGERLLTVLLACCLCAALVISSPMPVMAERVIGAQDASYGASEIPTEGVSGGCDVKVIIVDKLSRYAVDLSYEEHRLSVVSSGLCWDVNSLTYVLSDTSMSDTAYAEHVIPMHLCNYSDLAVNVTGAVTQTMYGVGYTLEAPGTVTVAAATPTTATDIGAPGTQTMSFMLRVPSLTALTESVASSQGHKAGTFVLGTLTVSVGASN